MVTPPMPKAPGRRPTNEGRAAAPIHPDICAPGTSRSGAITSQSGGDVPFSGDEIREEAGFDPEELPDLPSEDIDEDED